MILQPRENPFLVGQEAAENLLSDAKSSGRMHHAWLMTGPEGVGKATLAYRFARHLLSGLADTGTLGMDPDHPIFRRVAANTHADLLTIEREVNVKTGKMRGEIPIDDVRKVASFLRLTPAEGGWRVVIIDGAEDIAERSSNVLLKVLEEPPPRAVLILVCSAAGRLLPTIRSRCRRLRMPHLPGRALDELLARYLPQTDLATRDRLASLADGSIGRALTLSGSGGIPAASLVDRVLASLPHPKPGLADEVADGLGRGEDSFGTFMELLRAAIANAVRDAAAGRPDPDQAMLISARPLDAWVDIWQALGTLQSETEGLYLDKRQAIASTIGLLAVKA